VKQKEDGIRQSYKKIAKLTYGTNGLVTFLRRLFLNATDNDKNHFNYYFALKSHINNLEEDGVDVKSFDEVIRQPGLTIMKQKREVKQPEKNRQIWESRMVVD
jgi:hypothetical protein